MNSLYAISATSFGAIQCAPLRSARGTSTDEGADALWARRALYRLDGDPILVQEVFLPALLRVQAAGSSHARPE